VRSYEDGTAMASDPNVCFLLSPSLVPILLASKTRWC
jgi:hypothetical protein